MIAPDVDIGKLLADLTDEEKIQVQRLMTEESKSLWLPSAGPQTRAALSPADTLLYGGQAGGGKGLVMTSNILTPFGWRTVDSIKVGDSICATDGTTQEVLQVFHRGIQPTFKFIWSDGAETTVDADHLWLGWWSGKSRKIANQKTSGEAGARIWTTEQINDRMQKQNARRFAIPGISAPCLFNVAGQKKGPHKFIKRSIPPYVLGVILGDGTVNGKDVRWSKPDREIRDRVQSQLEEWCGTRVDIAEYLHKGEQNPAFRISNSAGLTEHFADLGLVGKVSHEKFIPRIYLLGSVEERWELLAGMMDTDGWAEEDGDCYFGSTSPQLTSDVEFLARSLGAMTTRRERVPNYTYKGETFAGRDFYTVRIKMRDPQRMFTLPRKQGRCQDKVSQHMARFLDRIEPQEPAETACFVVSNPNRLFIVDDFVVTHNTDLVLGLAFTQHKRSLILRRKYTDLGSLIDRAVSINGTRKGFNGSPPPKLKTVDGRLIQFGANQFLGDEHSWQGNPMDLKAFDEACQFAESQIRFHMGWLRSADPEQRCRAILASNPPISAEGDWVIGYFRPWLDLTHHNPAKPGELRWYITDEHGRDEEVPGPEPIARGGRLYRPMSRTFIPSRLNDNPFLARTDYAAKLDALPEPLRSAVRDGNFMAARADAEHQIIPLQWVLEAQERWKPDGWRKYAMTAMGFDPAGGGKDSEELIARHGGWFSEISTVAGKATEGSSKGIIEVMLRRRDKAPVVVDVGGGYASAAILRFEDNGVEYVRFNSSHSPQGRALKVGHAFANRRAEAWWRMREALDPGQDGGSAIALPPDPELRADLTAPVYSAKVLEQRGVIQVESKEELRERLGRSPGKGDACVMCLYGGHSVVEKIVLSGNSGSHAFAVTKSGPLSRYRSRRR